MSSFTRQGGDPFSPGPTTPAKPAARTTAEHLISRLSGDFPLHSVSEIRRAALQAMDNLGSQSEASEILECAKYRLREGLV